MVLPSLRRSVAVRAWLFAVCVSVLLSRPCQGASTSCINEGTFRCTTETGTGSTPQSVPTTSEPETTTAPESTPESTAGPETTPEQESTPARETTAAPETTSETESTSPPESTPGPVANETTTGEQTVTGQDATVAAVATTPPDEDTTTLPAATAEASTESATTEEVTSAEASTEPTTPKQSETTTAETAAEAMTETATTQAATTTEPPTTAEATTETATTQAATTTEPATTEPVPVHPDGCPNKYGSSCFQFFYDDKTYHEAFEACRQLGSGVYLASFSTVEESEHIKVQIESSSEPETNYWIGLGLNRYQWLDGSAVHYAKLTQSPPPQNCVVLQAGSNDWAYSSCTAEMVYALCEFSLSDSVTCTFQNEDACYVFSSDPLSFTDASNHCTSQNGALLQIETAQEQTYIQTELGSSAVWIGISVDGPAGYTWADGTSASSLYLGSDNGAFGEVCFVLDYFDGSYWNDRDCGVPRNYCCKWTQ